MAEHLTIPGALEWDAVERHSIATLRYAGGKEHDVKYVSEVAYDAALARGAALREELERTKKAYEAYGIDFDRSEEKAEALQQRLTVTENLLKRSQEFVAFVHKCCRKNKEYAPLHWQEMVELDRDLTAGKP